MGTSRSQLKKLVHQGRGGRRPVLERNNEENDEASFEESIQQTYFAGLVGVNILGGI